MLYLHFNTHFIYLNKYFSILNSKVCIVFSKLKVMLVVKLFKKELLLDYLIIIIKDFKIYSNVLEEISSLK